MKNGDILALYETLKRISEDKEIKLNVVAGYILAKNKEKLRQEAALIYKMRQDIIMEHGELKGSTIIVPKEYIDEVNQQINDLMEIDTEVELKKIPINLIQELQLSLEEIEKLSVIIEPFEFTGSQIIEFEKKTDE